MEIEIPTREGRRKVKDLECEVSEDEEILACKGKSQKGDYVFNIKLDIEEIEKEHQLTTGLSY